jgi:hypothetical protein
MHTYSDGPPLSHPLITGDDVSEGASQATWLPIFFFKKKTVRGLDCGSLWVMICDPELLVAANLMFSFLFFFFPNSESPYVYITNI